MTANQRTTRRPRVGSRPRREIAPRVAILPYGGSDGATALKNGIVDAGPFCTKLRVESSAFRGRANDLLINWGNSHLPAVEFDRVRGSARLMNHPLSVANASNKIQSFVMMDSDNVPTVEWTVDRAEALQWWNEGYLVYARTRLQGHSGEGIVMCHRQPASIEGVGNAFQVQYDLPHARLYTKGLTEQRREFRVHVMNGVIINVQQKKRADGWRENAAYSNVVRNYHTGWIYANGDISPNQAALDASVAAVRALGLDFGAVDVITRRDQAWVLEVNTAPGMQGSNLHTYVSSFVNVFLNNPLIAWVPPVQQGVTDDNSQQPNIARHGVANATEHVDGSGEGDETPEAPTRARRAAEQSRRVETVAEQPAVSPVNSRRNATQPENAPTQNLVFVRDTGFYRATVRGVATIVQFNADVNGYYMPGWEIPMNEGDEGFTVDLSQEIEV